MTQQHVDSLQQAQRWVAQDPDPATRVTLQTLLDRGDHEQLSQLFSGRLAFGTAGLRAEVGVGPLRMNQLVVAQTAAGLNRWLAERLDVPASIVIGFDARLSSAGFAATAASVFAAEGHQVIAYGSAIPTPLLAYAVQRERADLGVMVTASHNPATDNGFKVYLGGRLGTGAQLNTPDDKHISEATLAAAEEVLQLPLPPVTTTDTKELIDSYAHQLATKMATPNGDLPFVYTAMHGVGYQAFAAVLEKSVFTGLNPVPEQVDPDGHFPTAPFPNPELPGALDLAIALAARTRVPLVVAHDPDADRCAVAFRDSDGNYRQLTGDEFGMLIAGWLVDTERARAGDVFALSLVSHSALPALGKAHGITVNRTLTGFKWIAATANLRYGYEEAIGYCLFPDIVRDKDGISAALAAVEIYHWLYENERNVFDYLQELGDRYGHTDSAQRTIGLSGDSNPAALTTQLVGAFTDLIGLPVTERLELSSPATELPPTPGALAAAGNHTLGVRVIIRPSGTEPKLKIYLHAWGPSRGKTTGLLNALTDQLSNIVATLGDT